MSDAAATPEATPGLRVARTRLEAHQTVEQEIRRAQAEALGRTGERLGDLLSRVAALDREIDRMVDGPPAEREAALVERERLRREAATAHHHLCIQREALGLVRHGLVDQRYPVPPRRVPAPGSQGGTP
jgi:hypothetical protein